MKIYVCKIDENIGFERLMELESYVSEERLVRSNKFIKHMDKLRSLYSYSLLKFMLAKHYNFNLKNKDIKYNQYGKPLIEDLSFNITHAGKFVGCIIDDKPVGIDIEKHKKISLAIADRFFHVSEVNFLRYQKDKYETFYKIWTLKESYIKAIGKGFSCALDSFSVVKHSDFSLSIFDERLEHMHIELIQIPKQYSAAICYHPECMDTPKPQIIDSDNLLDGLSL